MRVTVLLFDKPIAFIEEEKDKREPTDLPLRLFVKVSSFFQ